MPGFTWDIFLPGEDLPRSLTTDYLLSEGDEITVDGRVWLVERAEIDDAIEDPVGIASVVPPRDATSSPP